MSEGFAFEKSVKQHDFILAPYFRNEANPPKYVCKLRYDVH